MTTENKNGPKGKEKILNQETDNVPEKDIKPEDVPEEEINEEEDEEEEDDDTDYEILPSNDAGITMDDNAYTGEPHQREGD